MHWRRMRGANVSSLETAGETVVRVASAGNGCSGMHYQVDAAPVATAAVGSTAWRALPAPPIPQICPPVLVVETGQHGSRVLRTSDGGRNWSAPLSLTAAGTVVLVGYQDRATARIAQAGTVWTTTDGGRTWIADRF